MPSLNRPEISSRDEVKAFHVRPDALLGEDSTTVGRFRRNRRASRYVISESAIIEEEMPLELLVRCPRLRRSRATVENGAAFDVAF